MKKEYVSPEINAVRFNAEDIIRTSDTITQAATPKFFADAVQIADKEINVFE